MNRIDEDYEKFEFYVGEAIEKLRDTENWSDMKIARWLRDKAKDLSPRKKRTTIDVNKIIKKYLEENKDLVEENEERK
jgi:predicted AAA+ superfamily ATPase